MLVVDGFEYIWHRKFFFPCELFMSCRSLILFLLCFDDFFFVFTCRCWAKTSGSECSEKWLLNHQVNYICTYSKKRKKGESKKTFSKIILRYSSHRNRRSNWNWFSEWRWHRFRRRNFFLLTRESVLYTFILHLEFDEVPLNFYSK